MLCCNSYFCLCVYELWTNEKLVNLHYLSSCSVLWVITDPKLFDQFHNMGLPGGDPVCTHVECIIHVLRAFDLDGEGPTAHPGVGLQNDKAGRNYSLFISTLMANADGAAVFFCIQILI